MVWRKIISLKAFCLVAVFLVSCGTVDPGLAQKQVEFSFENLAEYDEITDVNPLIKNLVINLPANTTTQSLDCKISFADKTLWSKTVKVNPTDKEQKITIQVDPYETPEFKNLPAQYTITGLSSNNFKNQIILDIITDAQLKVNKFMPELVKNAKLKHVYSNKYSISTIDDKDMLNFYIYDAILSEAHNKTVFTITDSCNCEGFDFINNLSNAIDFKPAKNIIDAETYYFAKDGKYYRVNNNLPFSGYLDGYSQREDSDPDIFYDETNKPVRVNPDPGEIYSILNKHSENDKVIIFRTEKGEHINIIFDKEKKVFTKEEWVE